MLGGDTNGQSEIAELDDVTVGKGMPPGYPLSVDTGAVGAPEVFDDYLVCGDAEPRVSARDLLLLDVNGALR